MEIERERRRDDQRWCVGDVGESGEIAAKGMWDDPRRAIRVIRKEGCHQIGGGDLIPFLSSIPLLFDYHTSHTHPKPFPNRVSVSVSVSVSVRVSVSVSVLCPPDPIQDADKGEGKGGVEKRMPLGGVWCCLEGWIVRSFCLGLVLWTREGQRGGRSVTGEGKEGQKKRII